MTKEMLLPLAVSKVRELSLENHLRLAAIRSGHGSQSVVMNLLRVLYLAYFMLADTHRQRDPDIFREGEAALCCAVTRAEQHQGWTLPEEDHGVLEQILTLHDQQLASAPYHRYLEAWDRLQRFMDSDAGSPIGRKD